MNTRRIRLAAALLSVAAVVGTGCSASSAPAAAYQEVAASRLAPTSLNIAPPVEDVVLTIRGGRVTNASSDSVGELRLSMDALHAMHTVEASVYEPFLKERVVFRGVPLEDLLAAAGMPDNATALDTVALNDYAVTLPMSVLRARGAIVATSMDGDAIELDSAGPIRVIFTDNHPDAKNEALWIWSLASIDIRTDS